MPRSRKDSCGRGHSYPENLYLWRGKQGCLACRKAYREKRKTETAEYNRLYRLAHPEIVEKARERQQKQRNKLRDRHLLRYYNLSRAEHDAMLVSQSHRCAICGGDNWGGRFGVPMVDHDHITGKVRGILCHQCNAGLGSFGDSPELLLEAIAYLNEA